MKIISKINHFYKCSNEAVSLSQLLSDALRTGDKSYYLVFMDLLEEQNPNEKKYWIENDLRHILRRLSVICPNVIAESSDAWSNKFYFGIPVLGGLIGVDIDRNNNLFWSYYNEFNFCPSIRYIEFNNGYGPTIANQQIKTIEFIPEYNRFEIWSKDNNSINYNKEKIESLFTQIEQKVSHDATKFKGIFL